MKEFGKLIEDLLNTSDPSEKTAFIVEYLENSKDRDKLWMIFLLSGGRLKKNFTSSKLIEWTLETAGIDSRLFEDSLSFSGDLAETMTLLLHNSGASSSISLEDCCRFISRSSEMSEHELREGINEIRESLGKAELYAFNRLLTGGLKRCATHGQLAKAVAIYENTDAYTAARIISGNWRPENSYYPEVVENAERAASLVRPCPFCVAGVLNGNPAELGKKQEWIAEWSIDGIRAQLIRKNGEFCLWSEGEEIITDKFPEVSRASSELPEGTVLDGVIVCRKAGKPLSFGSLQRRASIKKPTPRTLLEFPAVYIAFDMLECNGDDVRILKLSERRELLEALSKHFSPEIIEISEKIRFTSWKELSGILQTIVNKGTEGILLRRIDSIYDPGCTGELWLKLKREPVRIDAVLTCASPSPDSSSALLTEYTFAVWHEEKMVTIARTSRGLGKSEMMEIDNYIRLNTLERYGPVRTVKPELVFEIEFEGVTVSARRKSGIALRSPKISKWKKEKQPHDAGTLSSLKVLLNAE
ncbi:MAG: hypothetical protein K1X85_06320 [Ignavibacteria bacterium]|nr:hypothetical protein [Ignavibacteria bacterium]